MKNIFRNTSRGGILVVAALLVACATTEPTPAPSPKPVVVAPPVKPSPPPPRVVEPPLPPALPADELALKEGIGLYNNGDYNGAIKRLHGATDIWEGGNKAIQLDALKYMAFSYCVTSKQVQCKQEFEKALKLDSAFDLAPGEKGHPLWGPVFARAKKGLKIK